MRESECTGGRQCRAFAATCRCCGQKGHFWRLCPALTPQGGAPVAHPFIRTSPLPPGAVIVGGVEMGGVAARGDQLLTGPSRHVSYTAVADTGAQVSVAGRLLLGDLGISQRQLQATPTAVTHVAGGSMGLLGTITCQVSVGTVSTTECIYIAQGVQQLYLSLKACKPFAWSITPSAPPFTPTKCVCCGATRHPTRPTSPGIATSRTCRGNVDRLEKWFLEHFGRMCLPWDARRVPEMSGPPHHVPPTADTRPHASTSSLSPAPLL
ncbi:hypothetical protein GWK47_017580 [Chionoecetes opilio]|uniref:CCHC-type domain-containing protein n=1 Tax=Chionoecetes opilio TaxID=41210 RepID=A0A8J4XTU3_CHIOP|nr:hypothetical protein GWK47_017580 [Chionoecetes opilio]